VHILQNLNHTIVYECMQGYHTIEEKNSSMHTSRCLMQKSNQKVYETLWENSKGCDQSKKKKKKRIFLNDLFKLN
jgi:hypothetical protein